MIKVVVYNKIHFKPIIIQLRQKYFVIDIIQIAL